MSALDAAFLLLAERTLNVLRQVTRGEGYRGTWGQDLYVRCGSPVARYTYRLGSGETFNLHGKPAREDGADQLKRAGYRIELPLGSMDIVVTGEADAMPSDREAFIARARKDRAEIEATRTDVSTVPNAKGPRGVDGRAEAEQMEAEARAWAEALPAYKRTGVHKALTARLTKPGEDVVRVGVYLAALVAVSQADKRWIEPIEPANDRAA